ncbi:MAG TPA: M48 family metallopeptidase [Desulfobacterales bacterium]|nr:M48 family metallopeptidase [Desulfobacterales bacterium]
MLGLAAVAFGASRLVFGGGTRVPDVGLEIERGLRPIMRRQVSLEGTVVERPAVSAAFATMLDRLDAGLDGLPLEPEVIVVDSPVVNAAALPGAIVVVYAGIVRTLETPEQMAAVLAHELAHVENRDAVTLLARDVGIAVLASAVSGGSETAAQSLLRAAIRLKYSRTAEDRADARCLELLDGAGIDPAAFADALELIAAAGERTPELLRWLDTHADIDARIERARSFTGTAAESRRPLDVDWQAVRADLPSVFDDEP